MTATEDKTKEGKVTVFTAKKVITMDPGRPEAEAIAVLDGRVLSTGSLESMKPWLSRYEYTVDNTLHDKVIMPGFIEPHSHTWMSAGFMGLHFIGPIPLPNPSGGMNPPLTSYDQVVDHLSKLHEEEKDPNKPLVAWGFDPANQGGELDRDMLDQKVSKDRPVFVLAFAPHFAYLNSAALELLKMPENVANNPGVKHYPDGRLNGIFAEPAAVIPAITPIMGEVNRFGGLQGLKFMAGIAQRVGITTIGELTFGALDFDAELQDHKAATADPSYPLRQRLTPLASVVIAEHGDKSVEFVDSLKKHETDNLYFKGIKFFADGSFPLMGSLVQFPGYLDGTNGQEGDPNVVELMRPFWKAGYQVHCHANGDQALQITLDALADLQAAHPRFDHRFTVEHFSMSTPMQIRRLKALGGIASVNGYFIHFRSLLHRTNAYGPDRSEVVARLGTLEREGITFALHSDYPQVVVPLEPLTVAWAAVNRIAEDNKTVVGPNEKISVERAMRAITIDAAYICDMEDKVGSLEEGKFADFTILEEDPFEVDPLYLKDISIWGTALSGKLIKASE